MDILERIVQLRSEGARFAVATVVGRKPPVSSQLGDKAIILETGVLDGFIGGACSREIIRKQALEVLKLERPRLVRISPNPVTVERAADPPSHDQDEICVPMTCASEGALDVYVEPQVERKSMIVVGGSPIAVALAKQGVFQGYTVTLVCEADERAAATFGLGNTEAELLELKDFPGWLESLSEGRKGLTEAVVASMGHYDEAALAALAKANPRYLGLVSSQKRGQTVIALLKETGLSETELSRVRNPVGLDISAKTPNEVAVSIVAEMIQLRRQAAKDAEQVMGVDNSDKAVDPVCDMVVTIATAKHSAEYEGETYYFCCPNCRHHFLKNPEKYLGAAV